MDELLLSLFQDFSWYGPQFLRIQSKLRGVVPFQPLKYQWKFIHEVREMERAGMPVRLIVLKARQCGFSTLMAALYTHRILTNPAFKAIMLADKSGRTDDVFSIYNRFINLIPKEIRPMVSVQNDRQIHLDNPKVTMRDRFPGLDSGIIAETARDPNAGRSGTRRAAHLTECAFYWYANEINESVQNSIPLAPGTFIIKESTANGMGGDGEAFYVEWELAMQGESAYQPFFVAWYEVDDYALPLERGFRKTKEEIDLQKLCPEIVDTNLMWRRMKIREYAGGTTSVFSPAERFCQDFPSYPEEAFRHSGRPVFDVEKLKRHVQLLRNSPPRQIPFRSSRPLLSVRGKDLVVFEAPKVGTRYVIGADIAEGVEEGDFSHAFVMSQEGKQVARWHGHIDPDLFGKLLVELAQAYNEALIAPEINNMGFATLAAIKNAGYLKVYMREVKDEISDEEQEKMGWRTTRANKLSLLALLVTAYREGEITILDQDLLTEMTKVVRESDGDVTLTGRDRVVAASLALEGRKQIYLPARVHNPNGHKKPLQTETRDHFRDRALK